MTRLGMNGALSPCSNRQHLHEVETGHRESFTLILLCKQNLALEHLILTGNLKIIYSNAGNVYLS
jgi:hypothetical protein